MTNTEIKMLGESYKLISLAEGELPPKNEGMARILLTPSEVADFAVGTEARSGKSTLDGADAALCAAAHLVLRRGLPISELCFDCGGEEIEVFHTGGGIFTKSPVKCKRLCTSVAELAGCELRFFDVDVGLPVRVVKCRSIASFDRALIPPILSLGERIPSALLLLSLADDGRACLNLHTAHSPCHPSRYLCFAAAASCLDGGRARFFDGTQAEILRGAVRLFVKPEIRV